VAEHPGHVWSYDFLFDSTVKGVRLKMLTIGDEYTRECLAIEVATSITSDRVIGVLKRLFAEHGAPKFLRSDNGPEFVAKALQQWLSGQSAQTHYIAPASPWQNGFRESFHSRFRDECLWARSLRAQPNHASSSSNAGRSTTPTDRTNRSAISRRPSSKRAG
jgi:putative transposase